jgi:hypothetical protein
MKTKTFLISLYLILGVTLTSAYGQGKDTKSVQYKAVLDYYTPVYCGDQMVDYITGQATFHIIDHYKDGVWQWEIAQVKGEVTGYYGEVFKMKEIDKYWIPEFGILTWHYNLIGNWGHHYIGFLTYSYITGEMTVGKTVCH